MIRLKKILRFLAKWNELWTIPLALILWHLSPIILHWYDREAGTFDVGWFQLILFAIIAFLFLNGFAWIILKITFPKAYKILDDIFHKSEKDNLTKWQESLLVLWLFTLYLISLVTLAKILV